MTPLANIRVVDFGQLTAGANTSAMLADLGAEVIKVESAGFMDLFRSMGSNRNAVPGWWNRSSQFRFTNRNKRGVAVDAKHPEGRRIVQDLVATADVVVENFRRGVLERLGLDYASMAARNPRIVFASISSQGETGPYRLHSSFGSTLEAMGGIATLTGYEGDKPVISGPHVNYPDQVASLFATGMIITALREARRTGKGALLDLSQRELTSFLIGEEILAASVDAERGESPRRGNADEAAVLQDCFLASDGRWIALTIEDSIDAELCRAIVGGDEGLADCVASWCCVRPAAEAAQVLSTAGLAAAVVRDGASLIRERQLAGQTLVWRGNGEVVKGRPYSVDGVQLEISRDAPDLGQHTREVLSEVLGLDEPAIQHLAELGVTRSEPFEQ
ncbi:CaiB/BaiF CoA transferase family protein [Bradyrhizobium sp. Pha-3]|uniref:CaiB/BaiF CoA transferase family protein n=1 Tax=Bradyrhizobium sp. Pha-3 TaxID=208375 RepID=UPI0035D50FD4